MACFVVPMTAAIVTTAVSKNVPKELHFDWLNSMLWGGVTMLAVEHVAHGEVVSYPPFLTRGLSEVLPEMLKVGVPMTLAIFCVWGIMVGIASVMSRRERYAHSML